MAMSLNQVLSVLRTKATPHIVGISLTIHSQQEEPLVLGQLEYIHFRYVGYGALRFFPDVPNPKRPAKAFSTEYLSTDGMGLSASSAQVNFIHNSAFSGDTGNFSESQSFLVKGPAAEIWGIRIDPPQQSLVLHGSPPSQSLARITISLPNRPNRTAWSVDLTDDNAFVRGIGPDPFYINEKALYCIAFGSISPYAEIN
jgi:hypothetical protein